MGLGDEVQGPRLLLKTAMEVSFNFKYALRIIICRLHEPINLRGTTWV